MLPIEFVKLYDIIKGMKCNIFRIYKDRIIGSEAESQCATLSVVQCDTKISGYMSKDNIVIDSYELDKEILKLIADKCVESKVEFNPESYMAKYSNNTYYMSEIQMMEYRTSNVLANKYVPDFVVPDLKQDEQFNEIIAKKASDGASLYRINNKYILTIIPGQLSVNKSDKVNLELYDIDNHTFIAKFIINKGKYTISKYIAYFFI